MPPFECFNISILFIQNKIFKECDFETAVASLDFPNVQVSSLKFADTLMCTYNRLNLNSSPLTSDRCNVENEASCTMTACNTLDEFHRSIYLRQVSLHSSGQIRKLNLFCSRISFMIVLFESQLNINDTPQITGIR